MALKNSQFNQILREYDNRQFQMRHELDLRIQEVYSAIPEMKEIDDRVVLTSIQSAKLSLMGDTISMNDNSLEEIIKSAPIKRAKLLVSHGYPKDYLEPKYHCPTCKDTGFIENQKCHCFKQAIVDILYSQSNIIKVLEKENFSSFTLDYYSNDYIEPSVNTTPFEHMKGVVSTCVNFIKSFDEKHDNLFIYGNAGVGKTFLTNCIAKELIDTAHTVIYLTAFQLFDIFEKLKFNKADDNYSMQSQFDYILDCDLLIIDDLGTELNNTFVNVQLYLCINERYLRQKSTIISTNLSVNDINNLYSERISSRIISNYTLLKIVGEDIRLKKLF